MAYNPDNVSEVWLIDKGRYIRFSLVESRFAGKGLDEVHELKVGQNNIVKEAKEEHLQAQIQLATHIAAITDSISLHDDVRLNEIRDTRKKERIRTYVDVKCGGAHV